jgi:hypothetical protein
MTSPRHDVRMYKDLLIAPEKVSTAHTHTELVLAHPAATMPPLLLLIPAPASLAKPACSGFDLSCANSVVYCFVAVCSRMMKAGLRSGSAVTGPLGVWHGPTL